MLWRNHVVGTKSGPWGLHIHTFRQENLKSWMYSQQWCLTYVWLRLSDLSVWRQGCNEIRGVGRGLGEWAAHVLTARSTTEAQPAVPNEGARWRLRWLCGAPLVGPGGMSVDSCIVSRMQLDPRGSGVELHCDVTGQHVLPIVWERAGSEVFYLKGKFPSLFQWIKYKFRCSTFLGGGNICCKCS